MKQPKVYSHPTASKGDIGVAMITADLIRQGAEVMMPISHTTPYDLIALYENIFYKIQVKYRLPNKRNAVEVTARRFSEKSKYIENKDFDVLAIYTPEEGCCYIHYDSYESKTITFRITEAKNNQKTYTRMFRDYTSFSNCLPK